MRLSARQLELLRQAAARHFGADARLWVFGSRLDDAVRGRDIDLLVRSSLASADALVDARLRFLSMLHATPEFEDQKIAVLLLAPRLGGAEMTIHRHALATGAEIR
jgi:predicted nucleotidyltransferase